MAGATAALIIKVAANSYEFIRAMETVSKKVQNVGRDMQRMGKNMSMYFTAPLAAIAAISVKEYDMAARSAAKVEQAIKSTGGAAKLSFKQLADFASQLQSKTIFGDDDILNKSTAQLLTFTNIAGENFKRAQSAALDLSTVLDGDLQSASMQLGKALNDPVRSLSALRKSGIQFSTEQEAVIKKLAQTGEIAKAQSMMLDELERQYGGQAEARAKEGAGYLIQLKNKWGDFLEQIGKAIMPALNAMASALSRMVDWLSSLSDSTLQWVVTIGAVVAAAGPLLIIFGKIITLLPLIKTALLALTSPVGVLIASCVALGIAAISAYNSFKTLQSLNGSTAEQWVTQGKYKQGDQDEIDEILKRKNAELQKMETYYDRLGMFKSMNGDYQKEKRSITDFIEILQSVKSILNDQKNQTLETSAATGTLKSKLAELGIDLDDLTVKAPKATGVLALLGAQIEKLENDKANTDSVSGIASLNSQIDALKKQVDELSSITSEYLELRSKMSGRIAIKGFDMIIPTIKATLQPIKLNSDIAFEDLKTQLNNKFKELGNMEFAKYATQKIANALSKYGVDAAKGMATQILSMADMIQSKAQELMNILADSMSELMVSVVEALATGGDWGAALSGVLGNILSTIGKFLIDLGVQAIIAGTTMQMFKNAIEFLSKNPLLAIAAGVAMVAAGVAMQASLNKKANTSVPKLAQGGLAYGPTYAMVGDNVGARVDPEVIAPLSKLKGIMGGGSSTNINLRISGKLTASARDLALQLSKENYKFQVMGQ